MRVDLHCHSTWSDGSLAAPDVAERAWRRDVELFSLTDHDTCAGTAQIERVLGERAVAGVEVSCREGRRSVHVLVYDAERSPRWQRLVDRMEEQAEARRGRAHEVAARLAELGVPVDLDAVLASARGTVGRPHMARALVEAGWVRSTSEAFERFLGDGAPADVPVQRLGIGDALELAAEAGGVCSLAHPHVLGDDAEAIAARYRPLGLGAIEAYYGAYGKKERRRWLELASRLDLVVTGGSDYHGGEPPSAPLLGIEMPAEHAARLRDWLQR